MNFSESFRQALDSLRANKLRSFLTMLGIVMGVFSIITIMALGSAAEAYMNSQFERIGANTITITYKDQAVDKKDWLVMDDFETVKKSQYKSFDLIEMAEGRFINEFDVAARTKVVIVEEAFAEKYFKKDRNVVGKKITLKTSQGSTVSLKIIGVKKSGDDLFGDMYSNDMMPAIIYMPVTAMQSLYPDSEKLDSIIVSLTEKQKLREVGKRIVRSLELSHGSEDKYMAQNSADIQKAISDVLGVISSVLLVIAIITLIVGGIGIVNILLVSVTERIREIGIRKALGARKKDIIIQFITESIIMTGTSGIMGIILGIIAGGVIASLIKIPPVVDVKVIILAFLGSAALGMIFGVYPAKKAADLDPIESLRYE